MLVLSRKEGEEILVGESIRIRVTKLSGNRVRLGIEAPHRLAIRRSELARREPSEEWPMGEEELPETTRRARSMELSDLSNRVVT